MRKIPQVVSPDEAVAVIKSGDSLYLSGFANSPELLVEALCRRGDAGELQNVRIVQLMTFGKAPYTEERYAGVFIPDAFFAGANNRRSIREGVSDYLPVGLSDTQALYRSGVFKCDVALIKVTKPDQHGYVSLGVSVDITLAAVEMAKTVIAVVDERAPRTLGDALIPYSKIDYAVMDNHPLMEIVNPPPTELDLAIGRNCAELIDNGACLQMGIGSIPNAILSSLKDHVDLGIHTEMFSDNVMPLVEEGVINGARKQIDRGKLVTSFMMGSQKFYDFIDNNPLVLMKDIGYTNDPFIIARNDNVVAINSALEIDLTGQVCADSLGPLYVFRRRRPARLHLRSVALQRRKSDHRHCFGNRKSGKQNRSLSQTGRRHRHAAPPRTLRGDRIRRCQSVRQNASGTRRAAYQHCASAPPGSSGTRRIRTLRRGLPAPKRGAEIKLTPNSRKQYQKILRARRYPASCPGRKAFHLP